MTKTQANEPGFVLVPRADAQALLDDLHARIEKADKRAVPVFAGIVALHDALAATPSTPSPQIGNAGAGPVGEAVAASIAALVDEWYRKPAVADVPAIPAEMIERRLARFAARTVEEPSEVERKLRERLEKELRPLREDLANACSSETIVRRYHVQCVDAALAALTGDAQEGGK